MISVRPPYDVAEADDLNVMTAAHEGGHNPAHNWQARLGPAGKFPSRKECACHRGRGSKRRVLGVAAHRLSAAIGEPR